VIREKSSTRGPNIKRSNGSLPTRQELFGGSKEE